MTAISKPSFDPIANPNTMVYSGNARFTVLKSRLIRIEYSPDQTFDDRPSQVFWYRNQEVPPFTVREENGTLTIETSDLLLRYRIGEEFNYRYLQIQVKTTGTTWNYGDPDYSNLGGTARTLDRANGKIALGQGLVSQCGWSLVDDSKSLVFTPDGWLEPRESNDQYRDLYFFGYGHAYLDAIREYQDLAGRSNLIPRWALGNWWSRYWAYTQEELTSLMQDFQDKQVPLSVCIVDMDWHITHTGNTSSGWTGYTWNRELFPNPPAFIQFLHDGQLKTALNLHPAEGVHPHESQYPEMAEALGADPATQQPIPFDIASKDFTKAYFDILHHPLEEQGVDFWWIDWQQGSKTKTEGLDPLYWLNHLHYYDLGRTPEKRPFIFSRWPGLGGHRYPIGFSGDTVVSWDSLAFQPEFTATASNVAYGWWSHDIGGHCDGIEEAELYLRWVQYGVFSPILRLHSTNNPYIERRPWGYGLDTLEHVRNAMQLRHRLIPLLYTANWENAGTGEPMILPMYYSWPEKTDAYLCPQEYVFCKQLVAAPFTQKVNGDTRLTRQVVWLPEGDWFDFFSGEYYEGGSWYSIYGSKAEIPVFAKAGAIIPFADDQLKNGVDIPKSLRLWVFTGVDSSYTLYEDDGESQAYLDGEFATTTITQVFNQDELILTIHSAEGGFPAMPDHRTWTLDLVGLSEPALIEKHVDREISACPFTYNPASHTLTISLEDCPIAEAVRIKIGSVKLFRESKSTQERIEEIIQAAKLPTSVKLMFMSRLTQFLADPGLIKDIAHYFTPAQLLAIFESIDRQRKAPIPMDINTAYAEMLAAISKYL
ncbi:MAG: TIM-barrel domain-containing protein [Anaerolineaceae bacterium]